MQKNFKIWNDTHRQMNEIIVIKKNWKFDTIWATKLLTQHVVKYKFKIQFKFIPRNSCKFSQNIQVLHITGNTKIKSKCHANIQKMEKLSFYYLFCSLIKIERLAICMQLNLLLNEMSWLSKKKRQDIRQTSTENEEGKKNKKL